LSIFLILLCVFGGVACLVLCGTKSAFLAYVVVIPSSHNIVAFFRLNLILNLRRSSLRNDVTFLSYASPKIEVHTMIESSA